MKTTWLLNQHPVSVQVEAKSDHWQVTLDDQTFTIHLDTLSDHLVLASMNGKSLPIPAVWDNDTLWVFINGKAIAVQKAESEAATATAADAPQTAESAIEAPMPGKILKMLVKEGETVSAQQRLFILEAMKMENEVVAPKAGVVKKIYFKENDLVSLGQVIIELDYEE